MDSDVRDGRLAGPVLRPPFLEAAYRQETLREVARTGAFVWSLLALFGLAFVASDAQFAADAATLRTLVAARVLMAVTTVAAVAIVLRTRRPAVVDWTFVAWVAVGASLSVVIQSTRPAGYFLPVAETVLEIFVLWTLGPGSFALQGLCAAMFTAGTVAWILLFREPPSPPVGRFLFVGLLVSNLVAGTISWSLHRSRRLWFLAVRRGVRVVEELRHSEDVFRRLAGALPVPVLVGDADQRITFVNDQFQAVLGYRTADIPDAAAWFARAYPDPAYRAEVAEVWTRRVAAASAGSGLMEPAEIRVTCADGAVRVFQARGVLLGAHLVVAFVDLTEQRAMEAQLSVSSRLAALGTLVTGVAHEINNPLTGQLASQGLALEEVRALRAALAGRAMPDRTATDRALEGIEEALRDAQASGERIARIVRDLSLFGRPDPRRSTVRVMDVVDEAMRWLPASVSSSATVHVENLGAPDVLASTAQLSQVVVNLVTNAAKAVPAGRTGEVRVRIGTAPGGGVRIEVSDDGEGIAPEHLARIFDPFFTTRRAGQGMGLGLPICHAIVTAHGGTIGVTSEPGRGSTFRVELPAAGPPPPAA